MANKPSGGGSPAGLSTVLVLVAVVAFVWGLERWRKDAARRAGRSERARVTALARCLLGPDGPTVLRSPDGARQRLRALAMATSSEGAVTWFDRCVPVAGALARHAGEVDNTHALTAAETRVADSARGLYEAMRRVGLVWRIRAGDPETDMDPIAERLARVAAEIDLAASGTEPASSADDAHDAIAPAPPALSDGVLLAVPGLEPASIGAPTRFWVGGPLPALAEVTLGDAARGGGGGGGGGVPTVTHDTLANEPSVAWHLGAQSLVRVDVPSEPASDGLAPLRYFRVGAEPTEARVTAVTDPLEGLHVALAAVPAGRALWVAEWTPWNGTVLARFVPGRTAAALTLAQAPLDALTRARDPQAGRSTAQDERVAIAPLGAAGGVVVAYTQHVDGGRSRVVFAASMSDTDRAAVTRLGERELFARTPEVEFCDRGGGAPPVLLAAGTRGWLALAVHPPVDPAATARGGHGSGGGANGASTDASPDAVTELLNARAPAGRSYDERLTVRCNGPGSTLVAFAREHARTSPVLVCDARDHCRALEAPAFAQLATLPLYTTHTPGGRVLAHGEWPLVFDATTDHLLAARAAGPVVSIARRALSDRDPSARAWSPDRVVFDAAAHTHGQTVEGLGLYAAGNDVTLAIATAAGLHVLRSADAGATWR